jgi:hypothetical protein
MTPARERHDLSNESTGLSARYDDAMRDGESGLLIVRT